MADFDFPLDPALASGSALFGLSQKYYGADDGDDSLDDDELAGGYGLGGSDEDEEGGGELAEESRGPRKSNGKARALDPFDISGTELLDQEEEDPSEDLGRLIAAIRDSDGQDVSSGMALGRDFDKTLEDELDMLDGPGKGKGKKKRRTAPEMEASPEVKYLLGQANSAYAAGLHERALVSLQEAVRIDPLLKAPWFTLSTIHEEMGNEGKALQARVIATLLSGAYAGAGEWENLAVRSHEKGFFQQAIVCYTEAIRLDPDNMDAVWDRAVLLEQTGAIKHAIRAFTGLLKHYPNDIRTLRYLCRLLALDGDNIKAAGLMEQSLEHYQKLFPHAPDAMVDTERDADDMFGVEDLTWLADYLLGAQRWSKAVNVIRSGARWLQGREKETRWDDIDDDREFDPLRHERQGDSSILDNQPIYELNTLLRLRLAKARMGQRRFDDAKLHFHELLKIPVEDYPDLHLAVAQEYFVYKRYEDAAEVYQSLAENEETNGAFIWLRIGECSVHLGELENAQNCFEAVLEEDPDSLSAKLQLAKVYETRGEPQRALRLVNEVIASKGSRVAADAAEVDGLAGVGLPVKKKRARKVGGSSLEEREAAEAEILDDVQSQFEQLERLEPLLQSGDAATRKSWLEVATSLVDLFRETRQLFPSDTKKKYTGMGGLGRTWDRKGDQDVDRQVDLMASRLERSLAQGGDVMADPTSFRGQSIDRWLELVIQYAFELTRNDEHEAAQETLEHVHSANVFRHDRQRVLALKLARAACYRHQGNYVGVVNMWRHIFLLFQQQSEPYRLLLALVGDDMRCLKEWVDPKLQKFLHRAIRLGEDAVEKKASKEEAMDEDGAPIEDDTDLTKKFVPTKLNPAWYFMHGASLAGSKSYQISLLYLLRALEALPPNRPVPPVMHLLMSVMYLQRSMQRQSDNRHHQIAQSFALFTLYRKAREETHDQEVEYNLGRAFHQLGLLVLATKHYDAVLQLSRARKAGPAAPASSTAKQPADLAKVAAYNLMTIYVSTGATDLARDLADEFLAV